MSLMKYLIHLFVFSTLVATTQVQKRILINGGNIIDVKTGRVTTKVSLLIVGERIAAIGKNIKAQNQHHIKSQVCSTIRNGYSFASGAGARYE